MTARQMLAHIDRQALTRKVIDYREQPESTTIEQLIGHEVHRPDLIGTACRRRWNPVRDAAMSSGLVRPHGQAVFLVQSIDALAIHDPAFAAKLDPDPLMPSYSRSTGARTMKLWPSRVSPGTGKPA